MPPQTVPSSSLMTELERSLERFYVDVHDNTNAAISPFFRQAAAFMDGRGEEQEGATFNI